MDVALMFSPSEYKPHIGRPNGLLELGWDPKKGAKY
jgi:hypothetical protein